MSSPNLTLEPTQLEPTQLEPTQLEPTQLEPTQLEPLVLVFKALSDPMRLKILAFLVKPVSGLCCTGLSSAVCACDLEAVTGLSQPTVSHHMKCLMAAGLVRGEKRGKWMYYAVNPSGFAQIKVFLSEFLAEV
jgi:ArsR family transcriptional regulator, arsenate/arsenite/antimonite-responsive transcriptional repressor